MKRALKTDNIIWVVTENAAMDQITFVRKRKLDVGARKVMLKMKKRSASKLEIVLANLEKLFIRYFSLPSYFNVKNIHVQELVKS